MYASMLRCFIGVMFCGGFFMRRCALPLCLKGSLPLSWCVVVVGVGVEVISVVGVCQKDSIVGWSAGSGCVIPYEQSLSFGGGVSIGSSFFTSSARSFHSSDTSSASVFDRSFVNCSLMR